VAWRTSLLEYWLQLKGHSDLSKLAGEERFSGRKGLWRVIWRADEKCSYSSLRERPNEQAYIQTKTLLKESPNFHEGHFYHAANCALTERQAEMREHLIIAIEGKPDLAHRATMLRYFENHKETILEIVRQRNISC